jgi:hypothetical protein
MLIWKNSILLFFTFFSLLMKYELSNFYSIKIFFRVMSKIFFSPEEFQIIRNNYFSLLGGYKFNLRFDFSYFDLLLHLLKQNKSPLNRAI